LILSDGDILREIKAGNIIFDPPIDELDVQTSSVDIHLGPEVYVFKKSPSAVITIIDLAHPDIAKSLEQLLETIPITESGYVLEPNKFVLSTVQERITLHSKIAARLEGRSTNARCGLTIHSTAPTVHATYSGNLTLEICNLGEIPIKLTAGFPIGQLIFERLESLPMKTLQSPWQGR
jgi:dCTP deaminase